MTRDQWDELTVVILGWWPNKAIPDASFELWFQDLAEFPADQVHAAIKALYYDGREWAPNGAQIRLKVIELGIPARDWGKAYELTMEAAGAGGGAATGLAWLEARDPVAADAARRYGWNDFCLSDTPDSTRRAQYRDLFKEVSASAERHDRYSSIEPAGLKVLEQANGQPTRFGDLIQLDPDTKQLGDGEAA